MSTAHALALPRALPARPRPHTLLGLPVLVGAAVAVLILAALPHSMADPDLPWHLRNAEETLRQHALVRRDVYSFTAAGAPWIDHEWLAELLFYAGWRVAGAAGVFFVTAAMIETIFLLLFRLAYRASRSVATAAVVTVGAAFLSTVSFGPRTLLAGWVCLAVQMSLLEAAHRRPRLLLLLPVLYGFWVNLHGSWTIGLVLLLLQCALQFWRVRAGAVVSRPVPRGQARMLAWALPGVVAALFANPWGYRLVLYPFDFAFRQTLNVANVQEWHSLDLHTARGRVLLLTVAVLVVRQLWRPRRWAPAELALLGLGLYSALCYTRFLFLFALVAAPVVARSFRRPRPAAPAAAHPWLHGALLLLAIVFAVGTLRRPAPAPDPAMEQYPSAAALAAVRQLGPGARVFHDFLWGGFLEWNVRELPVFIDSRVDLFECNGTLRDYLDIVRIVRPEELLDRYRIDTVFFERDTPLVYLLSRTGRWRPVYTDSRVVLLRRVRPLKLQR